MCARLWLLLFLTAVVGCSSARSTLIQRSETDECWTAQRCLKGVPITVQVPTHIRIDITEHRYLCLIGAEMDSSDGNKIDPTTGSIDWMDPQSINAPERSISHEFVKTAKIFTVDPKRPAAGDMDATLAFGGEDGQYFEQIDYNVTDKTITAITDLLGNVAKSGLFGTPTSEGATGKSVSECVHRVDNVVASCLFNLDAPDVELQISEFLQTHLNRCHHCK